jgi:hypothetical protein
MRRIDITVAASKMLPVISRGRYGWARTAALIDDDVAVAASAVLCVELVEGLSCSWML